MTYVDGAAHLLNPCFSDALIATGVPDVRKIAEAFMERFIGPGKSADRQLTVPSGLPAIRTKLKTGIMLGLATIQAQPYS
jgi:hypothetical protein